MKVEFYKYQGAGNDFVIFDNRSGFFPKENCELIKRICDRRFGVGADGLMLLEKAEGFDFRMVYFNADGFPGSMCGNGGRCLVSFAHTRGLFDRETDFQANGARYTARARGSKRSERRSRGPSRTRPPPGRGRRTSWTRGRCARTWRRSRPSCPRSG